MKSLTSFTNKSKVPCNIINNDIGIASNKRFTQTEFKLSNKNISTKQSAKIFNNYFIKSVYELIIATKN
jgi:hypothetical protein